ncbi:MAG: ABC transporter ATP-binding protein/permease [Ruminococcus sp.]|nr:ABC transporter ATP-binding protein/permease [Ruminococcus sp.]
MLQLKDIVKEYGDGDNKVTALNGVNVSFRENEFVAILGHSGCGKTTMLNIIGGLDHYTSGDLIINGISTKKYKDRDWDAYRNHSIGFIFQSYNLIPHQTVLSNVELALTISGVSKSERRKRAKEALEKVGLGDQIHKKPNQMSGGQMQRVAIARALINNPDILLADEPTGALDSETSIQVMELLKEIAKDKLVIMVTHNPELAEQYATRIVKIKDGKLTDDSDPFEPENAKEAEEGKKQRVSMSFLTAVSLSLNNLMTKKGRTLLTAFAGSIGIIGIALILSLSTGINDYIGQVQEETLSSYPIQIFRETADTDEMMKIMMEEPEAKDGEDDPETVYANTDIYEMFNAMNTTARQLNNMEKFKSFLDDNDYIKERSNAIAYGYDIQMPVFTKDENGKVIQADLNTLFNTQMGTQETQEQQISMMGASNSSSMMMTIPIWEELLPADDGGYINPLLEEQYDVVSGRWPENYNEVVVVLNQNNQIPDVVSYALGLKPAEYMKNIILAAMQGKEITNYGETSWTFDEIMNQEFKMILPCEYYQKKNGEDSYNDLTKSSVGLSTLFDDPTKGTELKVVGFIKPNPDATVTMISGFLGYTKGLTDYVIEKTNSSELVKAQVANKEIDLLTGKKFKSSDYEEPDNTAKIFMAKEALKKVDEKLKLDAAKYLLSVPTSEEIAEITKQYSDPANRQKFMDSLSEFAAMDETGEVASTIDMLAPLSDEEFAGALPIILEKFVPIYGQLEKSKKLAALSDEEIMAAFEKTEFEDEAYLKLYNDFTSQQTSSFTYEDNLFILGYANVNNPSIIRIYAKSFEDKEEIADEIEKYNEKNAEEDRINYTDFVALLMSSITGIISGISYLLIAFVGISLVVSSIMIGIITYISVLERTREIGILRAIGASKHDVKTVFNAETMLVGLTAGIMGILISVLLTIPINMIIHAVTDLDTLRAHVPVVGAVILVVISVVLTLISGLIPASVAAKKDPVEALRTE